VAALRIADGRMIVKWPESNAQSMNHKSDTVWKTGSSALTSALVTGPSQTLGL